MAASSSPGQNAVFVLLGRGDAPGSFAAPARLDVPANLGNAVALDWNGDGKLDLVTAASGTRGPTDGPSQRGPSGVQISGSIHMRRAVNAGSHA